MLARRTSKEILISAFKSVKRRLSKAYKILWFEFGEENNMVNGTFIKIMGTVLKNHVCFFDFHWNFSSFASENVTST